MKSIPNLFSFSLTELNKKNIVSCFVLFLIFICFLSFKHVSIDSVSIHGQEHTLPIKSWPNSRRTNIVKLKVESKLAQSQNFHIVSSAVIASVRLNGQRIAPSYDYPKTRTSHRDKVLGNVWALELDKGVNDVHVTVQNTRRDSTFFFATKASFLDWLIVLVTFLLPLAWIATCLFLATFKFIHSQVTMAGKPKLNIELAIYSVIFFGIALRLFYWQDMGYIQFQHDYYGHIEYIKFWATNWFIPIPHKAWEFPQQPFYYIANGSFYALLDSFDVEEKRILFWISGLATFLSSISLVYAYKLFRLWTSNAQVQLVALLFYSFVPSIVFASTRINNDAWVMALAILSFYYITLSYRAGFTRHLWPALIFTTLAFLTKVSALVVQIYFIVLLIANQIHKPSSIKPILSYALTGIAVLSYTIFRTWYPATGNLHMVNSGIWSGQHIKNFDVSYLFSFRFSDILHHGHAAINNEATHAISRSFLSYQYVTMLFGQFDYTKYWREKLELLKLVQQVGLIVGLIIPLSWIAYFWVRKALIERTLIAISLLGLFLQLQFIHSFPSVSNTDFRYHAPYIVVLAFFFAQGFNHIVQKIPAVRAPSITSFSVLLVISVTFLSMLISL